MQLEDFQIFALFVVSIPVLGLFLQNLVKILASFL
jgi:hypothetical protein